MSRYSMSLPKPLFYYGNANIELKDSDVASLCFKQNIILLINLGLLFR